LRWGGCTGARATLRLVYMARNVELASWKSEDSREYGRAPRVPARPSKHMNHACLSTSAPPEGQALRTALDMGHTLSKSLTVGKSQASSKKRLGTSLGHPDC
jgi:hypothetical protein